MRKVYLLCLILFISGCSLQSSTPTGFAVKETVKYICPNGSQVDNPDKCETLELALSPSQIEEAIWIGKHNDKSAIMSTYIYPNPSHDANFVGIFTHYLRIALASVNKELTQDEINEILYDDRIMFSVQLFGENEDFSKGVEARILLDDESMAPSETRPQDKALPFENKFKAFNNYFFNDYKKFKNENIKFILVYPNKREEFLINMSKYK